MLFHLNKHAQQGKRNYNDTKHKQNRSSISICVPVPHNWNVCRKERSDINHLEKRTSLSAFEAKR